MRMGTSRRARHWTERMIDRIWKSLVAHLPDLKVPMMMGPWVSECVSVSASQPAMTTLD